MPDLKDFLPNLPWEGYKVWELGYDISDSTILLVSPLDLSVLPFSNPHRRLVWHTKSVSSDRWIKAVFRMEDIPPIDPMNPFPGLWRKEGAVVGKVKPIDTPHETPNGFKSNIMELVNLYKTNWISTFWESSFNVPGMRTGLTKFATGLMVMDSPFWYGASIMKMVPMAESDLIMRKGWGQDLRFIDKLEVYQLLQSKYGTMLDDTNFKAGWEGPGFRFPRLP